MFPIKYIDNNLVWNKDNEVFAYYELIPYNYSFLSAEQKFIVHDSFRQLIAQSREGKIHALQIATESSIRSIQEQSKRLVTGRLRDVAIQKIDEQTEALVSMIGDNQVDYRFFIGFKLIVTEEKVSLESVKKSTFMTFKEFLNEVNHTLMNDFISMPDDEINRYMKMEKLLENKISRRFKFRRLDKNDFGYLIEHIYGRDGVAYEDYEYSLPKKKLKTLPEIAHEINIVNLTSDKENAGLLDPFVIMKNVKDAESLAIDILTFLTGISSRDGEKFPVLRKAVRAVTQSDQRGLLHVIDELRREDTAIARNIADHIDSFTDYDFAHLLFSDGSVSNAISLDNQLNIIQVADLVLPDKDTTFEEYTTIELLSVAMLIVISTFALDFIHSDRSIFKIVDLDEAWAFLNVAQGETLSNKLVRAGRAMQAGVYFVTQSSGDVSKESLKNNIGLKFAFRSTDINEIKQTLEFFGIDKDDENNQKRLRDLENGQCLLQDLYGRVGVVQIHPVFEELLHAFDTRPPVKREVE